MKKISLILVLSLLLSVLTISGYAIDPVEILQKHKGTVGEIIELLEKENKQEAIRKLNSLRSTVINARASLQGFSFEGESGEMLTEPFTLPSGAYRVHFETAEKPEREGPFAAGCFVEVIPVTEGEKETLFDWPGDPHKGVSTLYRSTGRKIIVQFQHISYPPFKLVFEKLE